MRLVFMAAAAFCIAAVALICVFLFMGGLQLLCMGIMGQYLAKTYLEVKHRPHYIIAETNDESAKRVG